MTSDLAGQAGLCLDGQAGYDVLQSAVCCRKVSIKHDHHSGTKLQLTLSPSQLSRWCLTSAASDPSLRTSTPDQLHGGVGSVGVGLLSTSAQDTAILTRRQFRG